MQDVAHVESSSIGKHHEFGACRGLEVVQLVLACSKGNEAVTMLSVCRLPLRRLGGVHLSSGPPSFRTMFRSENIVPKMSFASSCALNRAGRALAGPRSGGAPLLVALASEMGRMEVPPPEIGRSCLAQSLE